MVSYGHGPHHQSPDDLTIIGCEHCKSFQPARDRIAMVALGVPWGCPGGGLRANRFVTFHPAEREESMRIVRDDWGSRIEVVD